jgi:ADP-L-glycero-D-manno-heptose 6-epimerase
MRILITGYKGFIGQNMVNRLQEHDLFLYEWGDGKVNLDNIEWVIHLGAISSTTCTDEKAIIKQNYDFSVDLITACVQRKIPIQIASSASVYGIKNKTFLETDKVDPQNLYAKSKAAIESFCSGISSVSPIQIFRYFNVYGPHEDHKGEQASPYHKFKKQAETGSIKLFYDSEKYKRDFVPVEKVIDIHKKFFSIQESGIWNVGTGKAKSFLDVAKEVGGEIEWIEMPKVLQNNYQAYTCANLDKLNKRINSVCQTKSYP